MQKTIAFISEHASPLADPGSVDCGGQNVYVMELAKQLARNGYRIDIYTRKDAEDKTETVIAGPGIRVIHIKAGTASYIAKEELWQHMPEFLRNMLFYIKRNRLTYDLVHAHFFMSGWVASRLKALVGIPYVITFHALGYMRRFFQKEKDRFPEERIKIEASLMADADCVIAECPQDRADMVLHYNAPVSNIQVVPCGINPLDYYPVSRQIARGILHLPQDTPILLQLGRMVPRKGVDNVIEALSFITREIKNTRLYIIGGENEATKVCPETQRLKQLAHRLHLDEQVYFLGRLNGEILRYYYAAADIFITTPWYEPFGITPLEAMACATPVIGANVGGIKYSVRHGITGWLVPPKAPAALGSMALRQLRNRKKLWETGKTAAAHVHSNFTWEKVTHQISHIYEEILEKRTVKNRDTGSALPVSLKSPLYL